ncbi:hypothetical protein AB0M02_43595 [Actinoplanes sp. NPDC051861]|uniref:hypothetical protein n=1 Tax=Actinoplanes sp. NPDC051861 TaxID=3155170 RepID=UPI0034140039
MDRIPVEIESAVRAVAEARPGYGADLGEVRRRVRRRRDRRVVSGFAGVAVLLTLAGVGVAVRRPEAVLPPATPAPAPSSSVGPAQRLFLRGANGTYRTLESGPVAIEGRIAEVDMSGKIRTYPVLGADGWDSFVDRADGSFVALGSHDTMPGKKRTDGPDVEGVEFNLVVVSADGDVELQRDIRRKGEGVALLGATDRVAYLSRPAGFVEHDLASGRERTLIDEELPGPVADVAAGRLVTPRAQDSCDLAVHEITGPTGTWIPFKRCSALSLLRFSPDGSKVAMVYTNPDPEDGMGVALLDVSSGAVLADRPIDGTGGRKDQPYVSVSWVDDDMIRGAVYDVGEGEHYLTLFTER